MKKISAIGINLICIIGIFLISVSCYKIQPQKKDIDYVKAIDKVFSSDVSGMSLEVFNASNLQWGQGKWFVVTAGNKDDNFSSNNYNGVRLWAAKQLLLCIKDLKAVKTLQFKNYETGENNYYSIYTVYDYCIGKKNPKIYRLVIFVDKKNNHIIVPKVYFDPEALNYHYDGQYIEYEPNEITKELVNEIIKQ